MNESSPTNARHIFSVSELNHTVKSLLENQFNQIWLEAEISNLVQPRSGHLYLTLKDNQAQARAAMFRGSNIRLPFKPKDGMQVLVRGRVSLYPARGDYQLIVDHMEEAGLGALQRAFEELKTKLSAEGLFEPEQKRALPVHSNTVGAITSLTGAAIHDIITVFQRRSPLTRLIVYPSLVQGKEATPQIIKAIQKANLRNECDVLILGRGGGSLEDLWCFNDEALARAIFDSQLPIVSAIGHQTDFTIADFTADQRAPTPSAAAELLSTDAGELLSLFNAYQQRLSNQINQTIQNGEWQLNRLSQHLKHPGKRLEEHAQHLDEQEQRLKRAMKQRVEMSHHRTKTAFAKLQQHTPAHCIASYKKDVTNLESRLHRAMTVQLSHFNNRFSGITQRLHTISPLNTLGRGYSITRTPAGEILRHPLQLQPGDTVHTLLHQGELICTVEHIQAYSTLNKKR